MDPHKKRELDALFKQARLDGQSPFIGTMEKDGRTIAILFTDKPFVFKALKRIHQTDLKGYMHANHFTLFDEVVVIDHFNGPGVKFAVLQHGTVVSPAKVSLKGSHHGNHQSSIQRNFHGAL